LEIKNLHQKVADLQPKEGPYTLAKIERIKEHVHSLMEQEEIQWHQRAKVGWLHNGDKNTKFFHVCANQRMSSNMI
jgi:hypothetical protein